MICGLVLAAGAGTRFGERSKLLAELEGRPLLEHAVAAQCAVTELEKVVVVLGAAAEEILGRVDFQRAATVVCSRWQEGQAYSLRCGVEHLTSAGEVSRVIVTLGDQPRVSPELIARFVGEPPGTRAVYGGVPGHPVVLGPVQLRAIGGLRGDLGARGLVQGGATIECGSSAVRDVDTPEDLEAIRHEARAVI
ncbi:MAG: nucleotidyltransferase family protein [Solirubrobacterales bacterium]|nr:nucleotidyltransferase family protein [Solirubrobacterales bacterium]